MYRLFLYKTKGVAVDAPCVYSTGRTLAKNTPDMWEWHCDEDYMLAFDAKKVKEEIEKLLPDEIRDAYKIHIIQTPNKKAEYIYIATSYENIKSIITVAHCVAVQNELVMYDSVKKKSFFHKDLYDVDFVMMRQRIQEINEAIQKNVKLFRIRKLDCFDDGRDKHASYVVTLRREEGVSLEERVKSFYELLLSRLLEEECLYTGHRCFTITGEFYEISYTIEAYNKNADRIGYIDEEEPRVDLLCRMNCENAVAWIKKNVDRKYGNFELFMHVQEMNRAYPNPADRFVEGINIKKRIRKESIYYNYCGSFGGAVDFKAYFPSERYRWDMSLLALCEDNISPLLAIISKFYPYISERFYERNHLPSQMMKDIVTEVKKVRELIIHDFYGEELKPYMEGFYNLEKLVYNCRAFDFQTHNKNKRAFLYAHRYEAVRIFDIFIEWVEKQLDLYAFDGSEMMFKIEGP